MTTAGQGALAATMSEKFQQFHADNPGVYDVLVRLARQWVSTTGRYKLVIDILEGDHS